MRKLLCAIFGHKPQPGPDLFRSRYTAFTHYRNQVCGRCSKTLEHGAAYTEYHDARTEPNLFRTTP